MMSWQVGPKFVRLLFECLAVFGGIKKASFGLNESEN